ncbi:MAG TPA: hypothetical protein VHW04_06455 [Solirubrobacteraceae bacterium]|nr:hypothetical protein [Solirubrobacteraceae bacterium]
MGLRIREAKPDGQQVAAVMQMPDAVRRLIVVGALLTAALLALFAVESQPSRAATASTPPAVSPVTVTVPAASTPPPAATVPAAKPPTVTVPPANIPTVATPRVPPAPSPTTSVTRGAQTPPATSVSTPAVASGSGSSPARHRSARTRRSTAVPQRRLRSVVVRLSSCVSTLNLGSQRMLLLRAGIGIVAPSSRRAVARTLRMSVARETRREHAALRSLRTAAREQRCGSTPAWVHVPLGNRLVLVDPALTTVTTDTKVSFTPSAAKSGAPLGSGLVAAWWRLAWMAAQES